MLVACLCLILGHPMDYSPPSSPVHGIIQESWSGLPWPRDWTQVSCIACRFFHEPPSEPPGKPKQRTEHNVDLSHIPSYISGTESWLNMAILTNTINFDFFLNFEWKNMVTWTEVSGNCSYWTKWKLQTSSLKNDPKFWGKYTPFFKLLPPPLWK